MTIWWVVLRALTMGWMPPQIDEFREVGLRCADAVHAEDLAR